MSYICITMNTEQNITLLDVFNCKTLDSRDEATKLFESIHNDCCVTQVSFDFNKIVFVSRSFADQFIKEQRTAEKNRSLKVEFVNADSSIILMFQAVRKTYDAPVPDIVKLPVFSYSNKKDIQDFLMAI